MLRKLQDLHAWTVETCDDRVVGRVDDFLFDDEHWLVRYLVVGAGHAFPERHLLVSTAGVEGIDWDGMRIVTDLTRGQLPGQRGVGLTPLEMLSTRGLTAAPTKGLSSLRSVRDIRGCRVLALTGQIGRIDDVFADDERWSIPYLEITASQPVDGAMLIPPEWIRNADWAAGVISVETANQKVLKPVGHAWPPATPTFRGTPAH